MKPATPLPWETISLDSGEVNAAIVGAGEHDLVAETSHGVPADDTCKQDAAYIVAACNAYPELVAALRRVIETARNGTTHDRDVAIGHASDVLRELGEGA